MKFLTTFAGLFAALCLGLSALPAHAEPALQPQAALAKARTLIAAADTDRSGLQQAVHLLEAAALQKPQDYRISLALAEAWYRLADPEKEIDQTWPLYAQTEHYAQAVLELKPEQPEGHYWYGLSQLKKAQKKGGISAYFLARKGIAELERVIQDRPAYDHAGAARVLTLLYTVAPGWTPFGDLDKAIHYGKQAVHLAPDFQLNRAYLAKAYAKAGKPQPQLD